MNPARTIGVMLLGMLVFLFWTSWFFRYDMLLIDSQDGYALAYRLDRWTGNLVLIDNDQWYPVVQGNSDDLRESLESKHSNS